MQATVASSALALVLGGALIGDAAARAHRPKPCSLAGSKTVMVTPRARIFTIDRTTDQGETFSEYACLYSRNRRYLLSHLDADGIGRTTELPALAGPYAAYVLRQSLGSLEDMGDQPRFPDQVAVVNLATGVRRRFRAATGSSPDASVSDLVLSRNGAVAWIGSVPPLHEVHLAASDTDRVVDPGPRVKEGSLALAGNRIYWTKGTSAVSASIR